jgi:hypothetical protein
MLEYVLCTLLGFVMIGCFLYVSLSPEAEDAPKRPGRKQYGRAIGKEFAALGSRSGHIDRRAKRVPTVLERLEKWR